MATITKRRDERAAPIRLRRQLHAGRDVVLVWLLDDDVDRETLLPICQAGERLVPLPEGKIGLAALARFAWNLCEAIGALSLAWSARRGQAPTCSKGCGACCREVVPISAPEVFFLVDMIAGLPGDARRSVRKRFADAAERVRLSGLDHGSLIAKTADYFQLGISCPFLVDESCSIHQNRPLVCREHLVLSAARHCGDFPSQSVRMLSLEPTLSYALAAVCAELTNGAVEMIPLTKLSDWNGQHRPLARRRFDARMLVGKLLAQLEPYHETIDEAS